MLETVENIVKGIVSLGDTLKNFFDTILAFLGMLFDTVLYGLTLLGWLTATGGPMTIVSLLTPTVLLPFLLLAVVKAVLNIVK